MQSPPKVALIAAATCLLAAAGAAPVMAQYEGPRGHYNSEAGFIRDLNGTPCGVNCTREAQKRWSAYYGRRHHPKASYSTK